MQGGRDPFGDPFNGFGSHRSLVSSFFGGRDPFDDPFFTRPFGGMLGPGFFGHTVEHSLFGPGRDMFQSNFFGPSPSMHTETQAFLEHQPSQRPRSTGPIIEELPSDDENEVKEGNVDAKERDNPRKQRRTMEEPFVEDPDVEAEGRKRNQLQTRNHVYRAQNGSSSGSTWSQPLSHTVSFESSTVTYGGVNGPYYSSSSTRRSGSDGLAFEEHKEANSATRQATHRISKGIHNKGHSVTRKLNSDGRVDTMQMLHNLNQDELAGFEETWKGNARKHLPGWNNGMNCQGDIGSGRSAPNPQSRGRYALPPAGGSNQSASMRPQPRDMASAPLSQHAAGTNVGGNKKGSSSSFRTRTSQH